MASAGISWRCLVLIELYILGECMVKKLWRYVKPFSFDTGMSRTDGQTDRRTDRIAISISRVSVLTRDNKGSVFLTHIVDIKIFFLLTVHPSLYLLVSWAWWDWPLTWLTNHRPSVLWHGWLSHLTRKIVPEMTYTVSSGTLNHTIPSLGSFD